jgi:hypothetical protein
LGQQGKVNCHSEALDHFQKHNQRTETYLILLENDCGEKVENQLEQPD